jgi:hypothetical protein
LTGQWATAILVVLAIMSLLSSAMLSRSVKVILVAVCLVPLITHAIWRMGRVVAEAEFNPGIAPFHLTIRRVPVPVTQSSHFIVELRRGQYVVTSFRYFWP